MDLGLDGRTAIVCGASSGMGLAIAQALTAEGANVAMFARRRDLLEREADRLGALPVRGDLTNPSHLETLVQQTVEAFGGLDVLVLNGGGPPAGPATGMTAEQVEAAVELLLIPHVRLVGLALPHLRESGHGRIIAIESTSVREPIPNIALSNAVRPGVLGWLRTLARELLLIPHVRLVGLALPHLRESGHGRIIAIESTSVREPIPNIALSNAVRPGVLGWLRTLARELGPDGITVNTIGPGRIDTERLRSLTPQGPSATDLEEIPLRRIGTPSEIADVACFLASDRASYVTGTLIPVDGGYLRAG